MWPGVERFAIETPQAQLDDLRRRLEATRWPGEVQSEPWRFGTPVAYMREFVRYWLEDYDWRAQEARLNRFPHYRTKLGEHDIHFIHVEGRGPAPTPLLLTHGWPGSFMEMLKIIPLLTDPAAHGGRAEDAFTVIVPSIPGYGYSSQPTRPGTGVFATAELWAQLMTPLGYERFGVQGGDWGSWISAAAAIQDPERIIGLHLNYVSTRFRPGIGPDDPPLSEEERAYVERAGQWGDAEGGYIAIQATKPQTVAYGLTDSPAGLAAWLVEKFRSWSDCVAEPDEIISKDEMITDIMIYWLTNTVHSSIRLYNESREQPLHLAPGQRITPPCGIVTLPRELPMPPRSWAERAFNVVHWTSLPKGGHFAALEVPELLAEDIRDFFRPLREGGQPA